MRLGLCCTFQDEAIRFRTTMVRLVQGRAEADRGAYLADIALHNVRTLESAVAYCARNGIGAFRVLSQLFPLATHPDVGYRYDELPGGDEFRGREAIEGFLEGFLEQWDVFHQRVESTVQRQDRVLVNIRMTAVGRESGVEVNARYAHLWTIRDGLGAEVDAFYDPERALRELES